MWNYAGAGQAVLKSYGVKSNKEMKEVRAEYDPKGIFAHLVPGGFKL